MGASWADHRSKKCLFKVLSSLILCKSNEQFLNCIMTQWKVDFIQPPGMTSSHKISKTLLKAKFAPKKGVATVWWSAAGLIHDTFPDPSKTITSEKYPQPIDEMHWKLQYLQPVLVNRKGPVLFHDNTQPHITQAMLQKLNKSGYKSLSHLPCSPNLLPMDYHFFKHLKKILQRKCSH